MLYTSYKRCKISKMQSHRTILKCARKNANSTTRHRAHIKRNIFHQKPGEHGILVKAWKKTTSNKAPYSFAKLSLQMEGEIRTFQHKHKLRRLMTPKLAYRKLLRENYTWWKRKRVSPIGTQIGIHSRH